MTKKDRQEIILHEAHLHNKVLVNDLASLLNVSADTIRRDIIELDKKEKLVRVHGGAQSKSYKPYFYNTYKVYSQDQKSIIATKAVEIIKPNSVSLISGGTTNFELARLLPYDLEATFFTPSLPIAMQLLEHPNIEVVFLGGKLSKDSQIALGGNVLNMLSEIRFDNCFLGTSYLDAEQGLTEFDWEVVQLKKAMIRSSKNIISLTISEKIGSTQRYKVCNLETIDILVTELDPNNKLLESYKEHGIKVL